MLAAVGILLEAALVVAVAAFAVRRVFRIAALVGIIALPVRIVASAFSGIVASSFRVVALS